MDENIPPSVHSRQPLWTSQEAMKKSSGQGLAMVNKPSVPVPPRRVALQEGRSNLEHVQNKANDVQKPRPTALAGQWSNDLAKLRSEFEVLQQQLQQMPATNSRRESLIGADAAATAAKLMLPAAPAIQGSAVHEQQETRPVLARNDIDACKPSLKQQSTDVKGIHRANTPQDVFPNQSSHELQQQAFASTMHSNHAAGNQPEGQHHQSHDAIHDLLYQKPTTASHGAVHSQPMAVTQQTQWSQMQQMQQPSLDHATAMDILDHPISSTMPDCPLGNTSGNRHGDSLFQFCGNTASGSQALQIAIETLMDPELTTLCEEGLNKQLQRTKDGATEASRIQELAGLVKLLRKAVRELGSRTSVYVEQCVRLEKKQLKEVESTKLSSDSAVRALEAELAVARKAQAGWEAAAKADKAAWGAELESARFEAARLKRDLDHTREERDCAREDSSRAEQHRHQLEQELKELRKSSTQQIREVSATQSEVVRSISEEKAAAERREASLKEESTRLNQRLQAANTCIDALQGELAMLQQVHEALKDAMGAKVANHDMLKEQHQQLQAKCLSLEDNQRQLQQQVSQMLSSEAAQQQDIADLQATLSRVHQDLADAQTGKADAEEQVSQLSQSLDATNAELDRLQQMLTDSKAAAAEREAALLDEKEALKAALAAELAHREQLTSALAANKRQLSQMTDEITNLSHQVEFATELQQGAEAKAEQAAGLLADKSAEMAAMQQELETKDERLAVLEGEFEALKEVLGDAGGQRDVVAGLLSRISALQAAAASSEATRRKLHNELVSLRGNIRVYCRVKPHPSPVVKCSADQCGISINVDGKEHGFTYDRVFAPACSQEEVFSGVSELVQSALDGYHVCLFSYGQTGAGKTYTMQGGDGGACRGIIPRAVEKVLTTARVLQQQAEWEYSMEASFIEVYNNALRDLLGGSQTPYINDASAIKHDSTGGHTTVQGVTKVQVTDVQSAEALVRQAAANRACEATAMNAESSRSHVVFMLYIRGNHPPSGTSLQGCLCMVDLAGSERLDRSQAEDVRKKEACAINQSLSALGDIFAALSTKSSHVPYRNSKLTYLLQPCLGGQGKTLMFVNINPEPASAYESLCSLKFAAKVNGCELGNGKGGVRRATTTTTATSSLPAAGNNLPRSASEDAKRLSLPGLARAAQGAAPEPGAKRMSLYAGNGASTAVGTKRPPAPNAGGNATKRVKQ